MPLCLDEPVKSDIITVAHKNIKSMLSSIFTEYMGILAFWDIVAQIKE